MTWASQTDGLVHGKAAGVAASDAPRLRVTLDPLRAALALLVILNVSRIHQNFPILAVVRPALVLVALAVAYAFMNPKALNPDGLFLTKESKLIVGLGLFACVGAPFGLSLGGSGMFILDSYSKVIIGALLLIAAIRNARDLYTFAWAYVIGCGILAYLAIFLFGLSKSGSAAERLNDLYTFDSNDIGVVLLVGLGLTLLVLQASKGIGKVLASVVLVGIGVTLARSGSRGAFIGFIVTGAAILVLLRTVPVWKRVGFSLVLVLSLMFSAPPGYWDQMRTLLDLGSDYNATTVDGRKQIAQRGLTYMIAYPVFGLGINNFWRAECLVPISAKVRLHQANTGIRCTPPHNSHVQAGAELGVPGLIMFWMLVFGGIVRAMSLRRRLPRAWMEGSQEQRFLYLSTMYFSVAMVGFAAAATFVSFAWIDIVYILAGLMAGMHVCVRKVLAASPEAAVGDTVSTVPERPGVRARRQGKYRASVLIPR